LVFDSAAKDAKQSRSSITIRLRLRYWIVITPSKQIFEVLPLSCSEALPSAGTAGTLGKGSPVATGGQLADGKPPK
jgi:hypothetical protein